MFAIARPVSDAGVCAGSWVTTLRRAVVSARMCCREAAADANTAASLIRPVVFEFSEKIATVLTDTHVYVAEFGNTGQKAGSVRKVPKP